MQNTGILGVGHSSADSTPPRRQARAEGPAAARRRAEASSAQALAAGYLQAAQSELLTPAEVTLGAVQAVLRCSRVTILVADMESGNGRQNVVMQVPRRPPGSSESVIELRPSSSAFASILHGAVQDATRCHMRALLWGDSRHRYFIEVSRGPERQPFGMAEVGNFEDLLPGLRLGLRASLHCPASALAGSVVESLSLGIALVGADRGVRAANSAMRRFLRRADGLRLERGLLLAGEPSDQPKLTGALDAVLGNAARASRLFSINRTPQRPAYLALVERFQVGPSACLDTTPLARITVSDPDFTDGDAVARTAAAYRLTPTETAVVHTVIKGLDVTESAQRLDLAPNTVRWHLKRIFAKTGSSGRPALILLLMRAMVVQGG